jgi:hypothetical protein
MLFYTTLSLYRVKLGKLHMKVKWENRKYREKFGENSHLVHDGSDDSIVL